MAKCNVTVAVDVEAYRLARVWAAERFTTVSAVVSYLIAHLPEHGSAHPPLNDNSPESIAALIRVIERLSAPPHTEETV